MAAISRTTPEKFFEAVQLEVTQRLSAFTDGIQAYQSAARTARPPEPPVIWQSGAMRLLDYGATFETANSGPPILVVPSLVNRGYILDLTADRSLLRHLAKQGLRPLLVDWGSPGQAETTYTLTDYITGPLQGAFDHIRQDSGLAPALMGYCMGGDLALALASRNPSQVSALVLLATPWDFQAGQEAYLPMLAAMAPAIETIIDGLGMLPSDVLQAMFTGLNPGGAGIKFRHFADMPTKSAPAKMFIALEDWLNDGVPLAGPVARECLFDWYLQNTPATGQWRIAGDVVDPASISAPSLVIVPETDYIVPPEGAKVLADAIPRAQLKMVKAGHIGMVAGGRARSTLYTPLVKWLRGALS
jgi:polyhydroxyalkanoate synthase subunit PhaC